MYEFPSYGLPDDSCGKCGCRRDEHLYRVETVGYGKWATHYEAIECTNCGECDEFVERAVDELRRPCEHCPHRYEDHTPPFSSELGWSDDSQRCSLCDTCTGYEGQPEWNGID